MLNKIKNKLSKLNTLPLFIVAMITLIVTQIAPFKSHEINSFMLRAAYWGSIICVSWGALLLIDYPLKKLMPYSYLWVGMLSTFLMAIPLTAYIIFLNVIISDFSIEPSRIVYFWANIVITSQIIFIFIYFIIYYIQKADTKTQQPNANLPHFLKNIQGDLLYIKSEDHYLRIVTSTQRKLILYKLSDAIKQLEASKIEGAPIHRSYWVVKSAVKSHIKDGRKNLLKLSNQDQLPITATHLKTIKQAGYI